MRCILLGSIRYTILALLRKAVNTESVSARTVMPNQPVNRTRYAGRLPATLGVTRTPSAHHHCGCRLSGSLRLR